MKKPPPAPRRHRALTEDERHLWESVAKSARPLKGKAKRGHQGASEPASEQEDKIAPRAPDRHGHARPHAKKSADASIERAVAKKPPPAPLSRRDKTKIARGRAAISASIDLHGMTQSEAHRALHRFIYRVSGGGGGVVLVITGKGARTAPEGERGVLWRQVPYWLASPEFRGMVSGFDRAHAGHGGDGALYVRVRRARAGE
jgi:DNA-nicking Smr family endonuclease